MKFLSRPFCSPLSLQCFVARRGNTLCDLDVAQLVHEQSCACLVVILSILELQWLRIQKISILTFLHKVAVIFGRYWIWHVLQAAWELQPRRVQPYSVSLTHFYIDLHLQ